MAGSEIVARMRPSLLDLGIALAAGAAAAFAYTRPGVSSALAGIAIAVALVPPLCTVGIAIAFGQEAIFVRGDIVAPHSVPPGLIQRSDVNLMRDRLSDVVQRPVELELGIVHETILRSAENDSS
ncbi:MAG: DUF389 domain-containing protein [Desulfobacterales bacterium]|nr:DUF389 domain-containing protein [Desulfobacterales bacterium]